MARGLRATVGPLLAAAGLGRRWARPLPPGPGEPPLGSFALHAVIATYLEADVVAATVSNARRQGCERVLVVDNASPDDTVAEATGAGAELARSYRTPSFDLPRSLALVTEVMAEATAADDHDHVWWLLLDADEFPHGPAGRTVRQHLAELDRRATVVGARVFAHVPTPGGPAPGRGRHPLDAQPLCQEVRVPMCGLGHWKHPLVRWDRGRPPVRPTPGYHRATGTDLVESTAPIFVHHFQYRERRATEARLAALCAPGPDGHYRNEENDRRQGRPSGMTERWRALDAVYAGDWPSAPVVTRRGHRPGMDPRPWAEQVGAADATVARWYDRAGPGGG